MIFFRKKLCIIVIYNIDGCFILIYYQYGDKIMKTNSAMVLEEMIGRFLFDKASEN